MTSKEWFEIIMKIIGMLFTTTMTAMLIGPILVMGMKVNAIYAIPISIVIGLILGMYVMQETKNTIE